MILATWMERSDAEVEDGLLQIERGAFGGFDIFSKMGDTLLKNSLQPLFDPSF